MVVEAVLAVAVLAGLALAPVVARRVQPVPLPQALLLWLLPRAHLPVPVVVAPAVPGRAVLAGLLVLADLVVEPEVLLHLLSRPSSSAAMARNSARPRATSEPEPRSR